MQKADDVAESIRSITRSAEASVWTAYSGGLDSTVLLHASIEVLANSHFKAIHVDHGINPVSDKWAEHCQQVCDRWGVSLEIERVQLAVGNVELQSRLARYEQFERRLKAKDLVLTAHHADDVAETQLWQFLTGRAVVGIASKKVLGRGHAVRPFLQLTKGQLRSYAEKHALSWIEDPSNADTTLDRNWIRHLLLPAMEQRFPDVRMQLAELAPAKLPQAQRGPLDLSSTQLDAQHVRAWLLVHGVNPPGSVVEEIIRQSHSRPDSSPIVQVSDEQQVRRYRERVYLVKLLPAFAAQETTSGQDLDLGNGCLSWSRCSRGLPQNQTFELRNRAHFAATKIAIRINTMSKSLSSLFQENNVAPWLRDGWPILIKNERVVCIPGIAVSDDIRYSAKDEPTFIPAWKPKVD